MKQKSTVKSSRHIIQHIKRATRRKVSVEEKIMIVIEGLRGEESISAICRREGISPSIYYRWSKSFLEAGKKHLLGDSKRNATSEEVRNLKQENGELKRMVAELMLKLEVYKKSLGA
jgi:transposase